MGTYDTFVVNQMKGLESLELQQTVKTGSPTVDEAADGSGDWEEKRSDLMDNSVYDKINNVRQTPSVTVSENRRGNQAVDSEFYSKPMRGQQILRRANKQ